MNSIEIIKEEKLKPNKIKFINNIKSSSNFFPCTICLYKSNKKSSFDTHTERKHSEREERLVCTRPWCDETYSTKHKREKNKKSCLLECGVCGKKFDRQDHFNAYLRAEATKAIKVAVMKKWDLFAPKPNYGINISTKVRHL